jgi:hypothetical protein
LHAGFALERQISRKDHGHMSRHVLHANYADVLPMLGAAMVFLWIRLNGVSVRQRCAQAMLTVTGHLRPRPAQAVENALRAAFAELDRDLAALLGDRAPRRGNQR